MREILSSRRLCLHRVCFVNHFINHKNILLMKKIISFLRENPLFVLLSMVSVALCLCGDELSGTMLAAVNVVPAGSPRPSSGIAGLATHGSGDATTVSNARELGSDFIDVDADDQIIGIASDESVIDTIKRRVRRQVRVNSFEVDHYLIDDKRSVVIKIGKLVVGGSQSGPLADCRKRSDYSFNAFTTRGTYYCD